MSQQPVTVGWREDERAGGHVQLSLFVGRNLDARGRAGVITLRVDEWDEIRGGILGVLRRLQLHQGLGVEYMEKAHAAIHAEDKEVAT
ncbi:MAG: hypothetical protein M3P43_10380 [Actinomycetota bacterium]|nr:hypothetical protein [Actinomycetota bacterium]